MKYSTFTDVARELRSIILKKRAAEQRRCEHWQKNRRVSKRKVDELKATKYECELLADYEFSVSLWPDRLERSCSMLNAIGRRLVSFDALDNMGAEMERMADQVDRAIEAGDLDARAAKMVLSAASKSITRDSRLMAAAALTHNNEPTMMTSDDTVSSIHSVVDV
jgi:hypothetical protein